ncbi:MAG: hypothetical protein AB1700_16280, partial [Bacillota bacterium]
MIGDSPSITLATSSGMSFMDFVARMGPDLLKGVSSLPAITPAQWLTLGIFLICCILLVIRKGHPVYVAWSGVAVLLLLRVITPEQAIRSLSFNVICIVIGMMVLSELFIASEAP